MTYNLKTRAVKKNYEKQRTLRANKKMRRLYRKSIYSDFRIFDYINYMENNLNYSHYGAHYDLPDILIAFRRVQDKFTDAECLSFYKAYFQIPFDNNRSPSRIYINFKTHLKLESNIYLKKLLKSNFLELKRQDYSSIYTDFTRISYLVLREQK